VPTSREVDDSDGSLAVTAERAASPFRDLLSGTSLSGSLSGTSPFRDLFPGPLSGTFPGLSSPFRDGTRSMSTHGDSPMQNTHKLVRGFCVALNAITLLIILHFAAVAAGTDRGVGEIRRDHLLLSPAALCTLMGIAIPFVKALPRRVTCVVASINGVACIGVYVPAFLMVAGPINTLAFSIPAVLAVNTILFARDCWRQSKAG
jgi:hypothetical protein